MASKLPTVAIIGRANAGKSSLFNRLVRSKQAIVAREAGTTRDNVLGKVSIDAGGTFVEEPTASTREFWLVDTAGLKPAEDEFEASIQDQIEEAADAADVILVVVDSTEYPSDEDRVVAKKALKSGKPVLLLTNKTDLKESLPVDEFRRLGIKEIFPVSAEHAQGLRPLTREIAKILPAAVEQQESDVLKIALIGRPNVGKSNLFNTLAGKQQAIVANIAGTTRDINRVAIKFAGRAIELMDTAGVRKPGKQEVGIEKFSVLRTIAAIEESDICLLLMDVNELNTGLDQKLAGMIADAGKGMVIVVTKWDTLEEIAAKHDAAAEEQEAEVEKLSSTEKKLRMKSLRANATQNLVKGAYTRDALASQIANTFDFVPWAPLIFTSSITGQNVTKIFEIATKIDTERHLEIKTRKLNDLLQKAILRHPPAGLKNTHPKFRYMVQTDVTPPWFVIYGSNFKFIHWSYKRYIERQMREAFGFEGTPIKFSFRDEKQIKANREKGIVFKGYGDKDAAKTDESEE